MFNNKNTAFVVTDPQVEFLKPKGAGYGLTKDILRKYHTTENLTELFKHAKAKGYKIFISPHYFYDHDQNWKFGGQGEQMMLNNKMFALTTKFPVLIMVVKVCGEIKIL